MCRTHTSNDPHLAAGRQVDISSPPCSDADSEHRSITVPWHTLSSSSLTTELQRFPGVTTVLKELVLGTEVKDANVDCAALQAHGTVLPLLNLPSISPAAGRKRLLPRKDRRTSGA